MRAGPGPEPTRVGGLERQLPARLSSLEDLGLTKPWAEWGVGGRWTLGLMFPEDPIPDSVPEPTPWEVLRLRFAQGQSCGRDTKV